MLTCATDFPYLSAISLMSALSSSRPVADSIVSQIGIVSSLVADVLMPVIRAVTGGLDFSNYFIRLSSKVTADSLVEAKKQGAVLAWGNFVTILINFIIIAWILFLVVKLMNRMLQSEPANAPALTKQEMLLTEIRDLLKREQK